MNRRTANRIWRIWQGMGSEARIACPDATRRQVSNALAYLRRLDRDSRKSAEQTEARANRTTEEEPSDDVWDRFDGDAAHSDNSPLEGR